MCLIVSVVSVLPKVQEALPNSGLLQSSVVTLYTVYLTWSAVGNNPDRKCNHNFFGDGDSTKVRYFGNISANLMMRYIYYRFRLHLTLLALLVLLFGWFASFTVHCDRPQGWLAFLISKNKVMRCVFVWDCILFFLLHTVYDTPHNTTHMHVLAKLTPKWSTGHYGNSYENLLTMGLIFYAV